MSHNYRGTIVGFFVFAITLFSFPVIERSFRAFHSPLIRVARNFQAYFRVASTPGAGDESFPPLALEIREIVRARGLGSFRLSPGYYAEPWTYQQTIVAAWPIPMDPKSKNVFHYKSESLGQRCRTAFKGKGIDLAFCE